MAKLPSSETQESQDRDAARYVEYSISDSEFEKFRRLVHQETGIFLNDTKRQLLVSRLSKRLRSLQLTTLSQYYEHLRTAADGQAEMIEFVNRITTNKTDFFREPHHFDFLREKGIEMLVGEGRRQELKFWSAGCSTGEEPYTLSIVLHEAKRQYSWMPGFKILAGDLSVTALEAAVSGRYRADRVEPVPKELRERYFDRRSDGSYQTKATLKNSIWFRRINLMHQFPFKRPFDVVFCRNVIIYFDRETKRRLVQRFREVIRPGGFLFLGHSEALLAEELGFENFGGTIYRKP